MVDPHEHSRLLSEISRQGRSSDPFAAAVRATRMPMLITDPHQPDNPIVFVNDAFSKLTGYPREEILNRNCRFLQGPQTNASDVATIRAAIAKQSPVEIELLNYKKNKEIFFNRLLISPVFDEDGKLTYFFASQFDVTLERDRLVKLQRDRDALEVEIGRRMDQVLSAEAKIQFMLKAGRFGTWTLDLESRRLVASDICKANFGRRADDPFSYNDLLETIYPADLARMENAVAECIERKIEYDIEYRVLVPGGEIRWVQVRGQPFYRADGTPLSMAGVSIDVTERKRVEEQRSLLARELTHRVKNSMATTQAIANQTLRLAPNLEQAKLNLSARLRALSDAHDVLTRESWQGAALRDVVEQALFPFDHAREHRIALLGPEVRVASRTALAFALAIHELATNAVKYGALSNDTGRIRISWNVDALGTVTFAWSEVDGPLVKLPTREGFGSRIVGRMLEGEVGGTARSEFRPEGLLYTVQGPIDRLQAE